MSAALRLAGLPGPGLALLAVAAAAFVVISAAVGWRAAVCPADLRGELSRPDRAWAPATMLIPPLAVLTTTRLPRPARLRYGTGGWVFVFPLGMYATAGLVLGTAAHAPLIHRIGAVAVWPAAAWALTAAAMAAAARTARRGGRAEPKATGPVAASRGSETAQVMR